MADDQKSAAAADNAEAKLKAYVDIWTKAVDTQMHFNEMSAKSRQLGLTFVVAALGLGIVLLGRRDDFGLPVTIYETTYTLHIAVLILLAAAFAVWGVRTLDLGVYHKMLRGAVTFGEDFEENYLKKIIDLNKGMTQTISHYSRYADAGFVTEGTKYRYTGVVRTSAAEKIGRFYFHVIIALIAMALAVFIATLRINPNPAAQATEASDAKK